MLTSRGSLIMYSYNGLAMVLNHKTTTSYNIR